VAAMAKDVKRGIGGQLAGLESEQLTKSSGS